MEGEEYIRNRDIWMGSSKNFIGLRTKEDRI